MDVQRLLKTIGQLAYSAITLVILWYAIYGIVETIYKNKSEEYMNTITYGGFVGTFIGSLVYIIIIGQLPSAKQDVWLLGLVIELVAIVILGNVLHSINFYKNLKK
ncbi:MAG: hypothetical protein KGZ87_04740 [Bacteroidetes bacterium]|nr:hypothetical protein [Bacteroidota bacterium]